MKNMRGFTLIELVVVIVILGILAATAMPKFVDLSKDARTSVIQATAGGMRSTNAMIYAKASMKGASAATVTVAGQSVGLSNSFASSAAELRKAMDLGGDLTVSGALIQSTTATTPATCSVTYAAPTAAGQSPTYTVLTGGC